MRQRRRAVERRIRERVRPRDRKCCRLRESLARTRDGPGGGIDVVESLDDSDGCLGG